MPGPFHIPTTSVLPQNIVQQNVIRKPIQPVVSQLVWMFIKLLVTSIVYISGIQFYYAVESSLTSIQPEQSQTITSIILQWIYTAAIWIIGLYVGAKCIRMCEVQYFALAEKQVKDQIRRQELIEMQSENNHGNRRRSNRRSPVNILSDESETIRLPSLFLYELLDQVAYYIIFIAAYSFHQTITATIPFTSIWNYWLYTAGLIAASIVVVYSVATRQSKCVKQLLDRLKEEEKEKQATQWTQQRLHSRNNTTITTLDILPAVDDEYSSSALRIKVAVSKKLSVFLLSSFSYILAFGCWTAVKQTLKAIGGR